MSHRETLMKTQFYAWSGTWTGIVWDLIVKNIIALDSLRLCVDIILILTFVFISTCLWRVLTASLNLMKARIFGR